MRTSIGKDDSAYSPATKFFKPFHWLMTLPVKRGKSGRNDRRDRMFPMNEIHAPCVDSDDEVRSNERTIARSPVVVNVNDRNAPQRRLFVGFRLQKARGRETDYGNIGRNAIEFANDVRARTDAFIRKTERVKTSRPLTFCFGEQSDGMAATFQFVRGAADNHGATHISREGENSSFSQGTLLS